MINISVRYCLNIILKVSGEEGEVVKNLFYSLDSLKLVVLF